MGHSGPDNDGRVRQASSFAIAKARFCLNDLSTEHLVSDLRSRSVRGGVLVASSQISQFLIQLVFTVTLARLLRPSDFGLVAMVTAITGLGQAFADLGLSEATIQSPEISREQVSALFWINLAVGAALMLITMALAPVFVWFYREPRLMPITFVLSTTFLIGGLRVQPDAILKRQMRYRSLAGRDIVAYVAAVAVAVGMALRGEGYWAIVAFPLTVNSTTMLLSWSMARWRPTLPRRGAGIRSMITFGSRVAASYFVGSLTGSASSILIGRYWAAGDLGLFSKASNLLARPATQIVEPTGKVAVSSLSRIQEDPERFARYYLRTANVMMWIIAPLFAFLFVAAKPVILVMLGSQWVQAAPVFQILAISGFAQPLLQSANWVLISAGRSDRLLKLSLITSPLFIGSFAIGLPFGIKGVALSYSVTLLIALPWLLKFAFRGLNISLRALAKTILCPISLAFLGLACSEALVHLFPPSNNISAILVIVGTFAAVLLLSTFNRVVRDEIACLENLLSESGILRRIIPSKRGDAWQKAGRDKPLTIINLNP